MQMLRGRGATLIRSTLSVDVFVENGVEVHASVPSALKASASEQLCASKASLVLVSVEDPGQVLLDTALQLYPGRVVYLVQTISMLPFGPHSFFPSRAKTETLRRAAGIVTDSQYLKDYMRTEANLDAAVIPPPVYCGPFPRTASLQNPYVTMINPCAYKGIDVFLGLARALPLVQFAFVPGWGTTGDDLASLGREPNIQALEPSDNIDSFLSLTRVLLAPSLWAENFPQIVVQAMMRGIPVVVSSVLEHMARVLEIRHVVPVNRIENYQNRLDARGLLVANIPSQDLGPWATALKELTGDTTEYNRVSESAWKTATRYASSLNTQEFENYLQARCSG